MKLSFSTKGWANYSWQKLCLAAKEIKYSGIELHSLQCECFSKEGGPLSKENLNKSISKIKSDGIEIACLDSVCNIGDSTAIDENIKTVNKYIEKANDFNAPFVRVYALDSDDAACEDAAKKCIEAVLPLAEKYGIAVLVETTGYFSDTKKLRTLLESFASDSVAALWDMHHPYRFAGESPDKTIENLGAYVKHVHIKDSIVEGDRIKYCLMGEGSLPIESMVNALRSVNYNGYISLEWDPTYLEEINDLEILLSYFAGYMRRFMNKDRQNRSLYSNKAGTGKFVWRKESIIDLTFSQVLDRMVEEFPDQYAVKYTTLDYTRTYSEFRDDVDRFARVLLAMGVKAGSKVAVWATNIPQWYIAFWATVKIGAVLVTVNTAYKIHELEYLLRQSDTHTLIMCENYRDSNYKEIVKEICPELADTVAGQHLHCRRLPFLRNVITVGFKMDGCLEWEEALQLADKVPVEEVWRLAAKVNPHDVCNMQYTSGTTGFPKGVMLTHYNIVNNGKCIGDRMDLSTADRMMIQVPMFHCFGMVLAMTASMTHGVSIMPLPYFSPKSSLACINQERITAFHGVPTMFIAMMEHEDFEKTDFSYMRTGIMAGSPCPIAVMQDVVDKMNMKEITIVYGQTEASPGCTMSSTDDSLELRVSTVGRALPQIECKIVDPETGEEMPVGENGEFVARGYNIMKGYYKMPAATAAAIDKDGWLHTGDLACKTEDGCYRITGRLKDMIIRGGENIYPKEIEEFIYTHPKVSDVQVIGVPDEQYGEEIMACIILKDNETMTVDEMKTYVRDHMARHKVPRYIDFVNSFPMNAAGKILKYKMREDAVKKLGLQKADSIVTA